MRLLRILPWIALPAALLAASCRDPTQITVRVTTNLACDQGASEHLAKAWVESAGTALDTANCAPQAQATDNYVGTLVIVPGPSGDDAKIDVFVVGSVNVSSNDSCLATKKNVGDCLVVHRRLSFIPHTPLQLPVRLDARCLNVQCDEATETCIEGVCKPIAVEPRPPVDAGLDATDDATVDAQVPPSPIAHLVAGGQSTCGVRQNGEVVCWGNNGNGRLLGPTDVTPPTVVPELQGVTSLTLGGSHACAIFPDATLRCWGDASQGQVGNGSTKALGISQVAASTSLGWQKVVAGGSHTCALAKSANAESQIYCWGRDVEGQVSGLGVPGTLPVLKPLLVTDQTATQVALGANFTCAVSAPSLACQSCANVVCWGQNLSSQCFLQASPVAPKTRLGGAMAPSPDTIYLGASHAVGILGGALIGWGDNAYGQLGYDPKKGTMFSAPIGVGTTTSAVGVALGARYSCALTNDTPQVQCFGDPALVGIDLTSLPPLAEIAGGSEHVCALAKDGRVFCWGDNTFGQLGGGTGKDLGPRVVVMP